MRIDIDKDGQEQVALTKAERDTLNRARTICESLHRHCKDESAKTAGETLAVVANVYCEAETTAG